MPIETISWDTVEPERDLVFLEKTRNRFGANEVVLRAKRPVDTTPKILRINTEALLIPFGIEFFRDKNTGKVVSSYLQASFIGLAFNKKYDNYLPENLVIDETNSGDLWHELKFEVNASKSQEVREHKVWLFYRFLSLFRECVLKRAVEMLPDSEWTSEQKSKGWFRQLNKKESGMGITKNNFVRTKFYEFLSPDPEMKYPPKMQIKLSVDKDGAVETPIFNTNKKRISTAEVQRFSKVICEIVLRNLWFSPTQFGISIRASQVLVKPPKPFKKVCKEDFNNRPCAITAAFSDDEDEAEEVDDDGTGTVLLEQSQTTEEIEDPDAAVEPDAKRQKLETTTTAKA